MAEAILTDEIIDSAIGPLRVVRKAVEKYSVDDFVRSTVRSKAIAMKMVHLINGTDDSFAKGRSKITVGTLSIGGSDGE
jgi:hypothetical protein